MIREDVFKGLHRQLHRILRAKSNVPYECWRFQAELLRRLVIAEKAIRSSRSAAAQLRQSLQDPANRLSKTDAQQVKRRIGRSEQRIDHYRFVVETIRSLADGLAFGFISKWDIKPISFREPSGFLSDKSGLMLERRTLRLIAQKAERVAILNDLTNCLRHGDLTLPGDPPFILEMKSGRGNTPRELRQATQLASLSKYLSSDVMENWRGTGFKVRRVALSSEPRHHRVIAARTVNAARTTGWAVHRPESGVRYIAFRPEARERMAATVRTMQKPWVMIVNGDEVPNYYEPLSLSISDADCWWDLRCRRVWLVVAIDHQRVVQLFDRRGFEAEWDGRDNEHVGPGWAVRVRDSEPTDDGGRFHVSSQFFGRVAGEFLSLAWFVRETVSRYERMRSDLEFPSGA